jgi:hypothetical protein
MPDLLVIALLIIGPFGIWLLMRFLNNSVPPAPPKA